MFVKVLELGLKRTVVPVRSVSPTAASGACGSPWRYSCCQMRAVAVDGQHEMSDSALTTDTPTPCKPPETL